MSQIRWLFIVCGFVRDKISSAQEACQASGLNRHCSLIKFSSLCYSSRQCLISRAPSENSQAATMGMGQSKRSVDITATPKKGEAENGIAKVVADDGTELVGKVEKIVDNDENKAPNGTTPHNGHAEEPVS